jgi:protein TonB
LPEINLALAQQRARLQVLPQLEEFYAQMMRNYAEAHQRVQSLSRATTGPSLLSRRNPEYSETARAAGVQGKVELSVTVGADGAPRDIQVTHSLGHGLDEKAIECVKSWRFRPARHNGEPVTAFIIVEVPFRLQ